MEMYDPLIATTLSFSEDESRVRGTLELVGEDGATAKIHIVDQPLADALILALNDLGTIVQRYNREGMDIEDAIEGTSYRNGEQLDIDDDEVLTLDDILGEE